jgi:hypothetical protein
LTFSWFWELSILIPLVYQDASFGDGFDFNQDNNYDSIDNSDIFIQGGRLTVLGVHKTFVI